MTTAQKPEPIGDPYAGPSTLQRYVPHTVTAPKAFPLRAVIEQHADVLAPLCAPGQDLERIVSQLWVSAQKEPKLLKCTPASLIPAISRAMETGGVIGRDVHLLVFGTDAIECLDYKFQCELIVAAGGARSIDARIVYANDEFREEQGTDPRIVHTPPKFGADRGKMIGAYAVAFISASTPPKFVALSLAQIEKTRGKSQAWKHEKTCPEWYAAKCAVRQLCKLLPKNPKLSRVMAIMERDERSIDAEEIEAVVSVPAEEPRPAHVSPDGEDMSDWEVVATDVSAEERAAIDDAAARVVNGKALGTLRNSGLRQVKAWAEKKAQEEGGSERLDAIADACRVLIDAREAGTIQEPVKEAA